MSPNVTKLALFLLTATALGSTTSCGSANPFADALTISVTPNAGMIFSPGPYSSCTDFATFKIAKETGVLGPVLGQSVQGPLIVINNFNLTWSSFDTLFIEEIRITVRGAGISGGMVTQDMNSGEVSNMLALYLSTINPPLSQVPKGTSVPGLQPASQTGLMNTIINSSDSGTRNPTDATLKADYFNYDACNFVIGGITLSNGKDTPSFTANISITLIGTAQDQNGQNIRFVEYTTTASAKYYSEATPL